MPKEVRVTASPPVAVAPTADVDIQQQLAMHEQQQQQQLDVYGYGLNENEKLRAMQQQHSNRRRKRSRSMLQQSQTAVNAKLTDVSRRTVPQQQSQTAVNSIANMTDVSRRTVPQQNNNNNNNNNNNTRRMVPQHLQLDLQPTVPQQNNVMRRMVPQHLQLGMLRTVPLQQSQTPIFTNMNQQERITFYKTSLEIQYALNPLAQLHNDFQTQRQLIESRITHLVGQKNALLSGFVKSYTNEIREKEKECWISISQNPDNAQQLQSQHEQSISELQRLMLDQTNYQQGKIQQEINRNIQLKDMIRYMYESSQSSIDPPPNYGNCEPSMIPGRSSGYLERLRLLDGALPLSHQKLLERELKHRLLDINYGAPTVNGVKMQHTLTVDMYNDSNPKFTKIIEDDPAKHATKQYFNQVGRDKHVMEWISRHGKIPLLLRYFHKSDSTNRVPDDLILWFIQLMVHTDFLGAPNSVVVLVSLGPLDKKWYRLVLEYAHTFSGKGDCQVLGFVLIKEDGKPSFRVVDYSDPDVLHYLMHYTNNGDLSAGKYVFFCLSRVFDLHQQTYYIIQLSRSKPCIVWIFLSIKTWH